MWSLRQHQNVFALDATIEMAGFACRICSSSEEEPTHFFCSPHFFHFVPALCRTRWRRWLASDSSAVVSLVSATCGPECAPPCPECWRTASNSVNRKIRWREGSYESYQIRGKILTPHERIQNLCSPFAQIERHSVTNCCPVALTGLIAGSMGNLVLTIQWNEEPTMNKT